MKDSTILELAAKWERDSTDPKCEDGSAQAAESNASEKGVRLAMRSCAEDVRRLVILLGDGK